MRQARGRTDLLPSASTEWPVLHMDSQLYRSLVEWKAPSPLNGMDRTLTGQYSDGAGSGNGVDGLGIALPFGGEPLFHCGCMLTLPRRPPVVSHARHAVVTGGGLNAAGQGHPAMASQWPIIHSEVPLEAATRHRTGCTRMQKGHSYIAPAPSRPEEGRRDSVQNIGIWFANACPLM